MELEDKVVVITGAGRGIGASAAGLMARNGAKVVIADIREDWGQETTDNIRESDGVAEFVKTDVSEEGDVADLIEYAVATHGRLDAIVNNAATTVIGKANEITAEDWDRVMRVNVAGVFYGCKHAIRQFLEQDGGSIVNMGSISAVVGLPERAAYCASKGAVFQLSRQIAMEFASDNIRCNTVGPGSVEGDFLRNNLARASDPEAAEERILGAHPIGRLADPLEIAEVVMFLVSDRSSFVTGANLQADGGYTAI
ncbi:MAG: glucose 1-dehydrogenase [Rubrobacteraceae bacterium]